MSYRLRLRKEQAPAPSSAKLTEEDKSQGIAWCLKKYGISMAEAEGALRRNSKLPMTRDLMQHAPAMVFVVEHIGELERWVLDIRKEEKARKESAA